MNPHKKRLYKRLAKWLHILSYVLLGMGIITPIILTVSGSNYCVITFTQIFLGIICMSIIFMIAGLMYRALLNNYKSAIKKCIEYKMFWTIMNLLNAGDLETATKYYNSSIHSRIIRDLLQGDILLQ